MDLTLISIVAGLGLTELLLAFYQLVRARRRVAWDALPLLWALLILVAVVNYWWGIRPILTQASDWSTGAFMVAMISPIFLYLACAAALPRVAGDGPVDLRACYADERTVFLAFFLAYQGGNWLLDLSGLAPPLPEIVLIHRSIVSGALILALAARSRRWDWVALGVVAVALGMRLGTQMVR